MHSGFAERRQSERRSEAYARDLAGQVLIEHSLIPLVVLQRPNWDGGPRKQTDFFRLWKATARSLALAVCELWSHVFGWEALLLVVGELCRD